MMKTIPAIGVAALALIATAPAVAMDRYGAIGPAASRAAIHDPDQRLEQLAAASQPRGDGHVRAPKGLLSILRDDPELKRAFAWLGTK